MALNEQGVSSFKTLQNVLSEERDMALQYYVFDLLYLDGRDLTNLPLLARKKQLKPLLKAKPLKNHVFYSEHVAGRDEAFLKHLCGMDIASSRSWYSSASDPVK